MSNVDLFVSLGFSEQRAKETAGNKKISANLAQIVNEVGIDRAKKYSALLYTVASTVTANSMSHLMYMAHAVVNERLKSADQIAAAVKFCDKLGSGDIIDSTAFDSACGVGVVIGEKELEDLIKELLESKKAELIEKRYQLLGPLLTAAKSSKLRWANALLVKTEIDKQMLAMLGPKDDRDSLKKEKKNDASDIMTSSNPPIKSSVCEMAKSSKFVFEGALSKLHRPGENPQINEQLMKDHLKRTSGKVVTRFPPEPNGFLHIGHAKALNVNFGFANAHNGITYLRYDDTNPDAEEEKYFTSILETVEWMGFKPYEVTYSSDHFERLYDLAVDLIKRDKAYVCHCSGEEIHEMRGGDSKGPRSECSHRHRPVEESLREFSRMKGGEYDEGEAILRMKMDMQNPSPQMWDLVAYRVKFTPHHRTGDSWCVYPTYDYTHCLCDSFEDITHSLCTTEFQTARESYYWLVDALELYKPVQWEYGRLNLEYAILSKRKLLKLVDEGYVDGWDDPRLFTLIALRRRGFTPDAISAFVREIGVTTANSVIPFDKLEFYVRDHLNDIAPRIMAIIDPIKVTIINLPDDYREVITVANKPRDESMGLREIPFTRTIFIDSSDFREKEDPNFFRLTLGKSVGLLNIPHPITAKEILRDSSGKVVGINAIYENTPGVKIKPKTYIQWVADSPQDRSPVPIELRLFEHLFKHSNPFDKKLVPGGWMSDINPNSLTVITTAIAETGIRNAKVEDKFQFLRIGYFCLDRESDAAAGKFIFNRTVSLKEDNAKDL